MQPPGIVDRGVLVTPTGLEQQDAARTTVDQAARDDRAGRAGADNDDVGIAIAHVSASFAISRARAT